jgi:hypothetical protein
MASHAEKDVITDEAKAVIADKPQPQTRGKGKGGKGKGKGKVETSIQNNERIQRLDQLYSKNKRQTLFVPTLKTTDEGEKPGQVSHVVLKVRRIICDKGFPVGTEVDIKSSRLKNALAKIFEGLEGLQLNESPPIITPELLFHGWGRLAELVKTEESKPSPDKTLVDELRVALQFIAEDYASTQATLDSLSEHEEITFDLLWTVFPPNIAVYTKNNLLREHQICKLQKCEYGRTETGAKFFDLTVNFISHDGTKLGWASQKIRIGLFDGANKVYNLSVVPLSLLPTKDVVCTELAKRGKKYVEMIEAPRGTYQEYVGAVVSENRDVFVEEEYKKVIIHVSGRVMLDSKTMVQQNEYTGLLKPAVENELETATLTDDDLLYCHQQPRACHLEPRCIFQTRHGRTQTQPHPLPCQIASKRG